MSAPEKLKSNDSSLNNYNFVSILKFQLSKTLYFCMFKVLLESLKKIFTLKNKWGKCKRHLYQELLQHKILQNGHYFTRCCNSMLVIVVNTGFQNHLIL